MTTPDSPILRGPARPELIRNEILADLLEATASRIPETVALIDGDRQLTYRELDTQADRIAAQLIADGVRPGMMVGLWLPRGLDLLLMQAAIAKTGAAWLPCDADTPVERIAVCLEDANAAGILTCTAFAPALATITDELPITVWTAETLQTAPVAEPLLRRQGALPSHPAYVIYTSGSTGKPKGIEINQGSICHFLRSENAVLGVREGDKVYQGFSVAFDMSFEEIWISYLVGATLWIAPKALTGDPDALPQALLDQQVTVLHAVPTLLALFNQDVPNLRIINLGGEMCPEALVARWAKPTRQVFNTYGPTEATVSASLAELHAGEPVTIGRPLPNYGLLVIDAEVESKGLQLLPRGDTGELCITGPGVAAGYLGRPDLTAEKFLDNPWADNAHEARLYRTGDLARIDEAGNVQCLGRADDQVKIRGFRVELGEIEAVLAQQPGVGTVAVLLRQEEGIDQLIAFIVTEAGCALAIPALRTALAERLPPYMVPGRYEVLDEMPRLTSGKIDRKALKARPLTVCAGDAAGSDTPETPGEKALFLALGKLFPGQPLQRSADFFSDLGGHSLYAARLASALRTDPAFAQVTVRDIYQHRQLGRIAQALDAAAVDTASSRVKTDWITPPDWKRWTCGAAQAAAIPVLVAIRMSQWLAPFFAYHFFTGDPGDSVALAVAVAVGVFLLVTLLEFGIAIAGKWLIAGRLQPGRYPLWGMTYFRWWLADRLIEAAPVYLLSGSSLFNLWLRLLGARVGQDATIGSMTVRVPDLLEIGDGVSIGNAVALENARVEQGVLHLGRITLEREACIGSYALMEEDTRVGQYSHLDGQSALASGERVPPQRLWRGSPARDAGAIDPHALPPRPAYTRLRALGEGVYFVSGLLLVSALFFMPVFPCFMLVDWLDDLNIVPWLEGDQPLLQLLGYFLLAVPASALLIVCTALVSAGIRWGVLPRLQPGRWPVHSNTYCRKWLVSQIQESSLQVLHGIYATVFAPAWYRLLGARVGKGAEVSTALGVVPDMLTLGEDCFVADAVLLGDEQVAGGWMQMEPTTIADRSFVGNYAYVPDGTTLPPNVLIGVLSSAPGNSEIRDGDTWLGAPPLQLPAREQVSGFSEALTFRPSRYRRLGRALVEAFRIVAPHALVIAIGYTIILNEIPVAATGNWLKLGWNLAIDGLLFGLASFVFVWLLKWGLVGRYRQKAVPMWTPFVWFSEAVTSMYEGITVIHFMRYLRGTPWLPLAFNLLGAKIGKGVYMDTTDITEFDCVEIGDYSELNALVCPQTHLFEDRVMKVDTVRIGRQVYLGPRSIVLYSAEVADHARIGVLTLVMKGENIPQATAWRGSPAAPDRV
jgi:non-ribosomal peptide synthetase-like protein